MVRLRTSVAWLLASALALGACSGAAAPSGVPSIEVPTSISSAGLEGFCADFAADLSPDWPNVDSSTAASLGTVVQEWTANTDLAPIAADVRTLGTWLASLAQSGSAASPPPDAMTAFENIRSFADANC
jgi:hypothetical protein